MGEAVRRGSFIDYMGKGALGKVERLRTRSIYDTQKISSVCNSDTSAFCTYRSIHMPIVRANRRCSLRGSVDRGVCMWTAKPVDLEEKTTLM